MTWKKLTCRDCAVTVPWLYRERELDRERDRERDCERDRYYDRYYDRYRERDPYFDRDRYYDRYYDQNIFLTLPFMIKSFQRITITIY